MIQLIIGIVIGIVIGILLTRVAILKKEDAIDFGDLVKEDGQTHESGFIDIPVQRIISQKKIDSKSQSGICDIEKLKRFKDRNRFYQ